MKIINYLNIEILTTLKLQLKVSVVHDPLGLPISSTLNHFFIRIVNLYMFMPAYTNASLLFTHSTLSVYSFMHVFCSIADPYTCDLLASQLNTCQPADLYYSS